MDNEQTDFIRRYLDDIGLPPELEHVALEDLGRLLGESQAAVINYWRDRNSNYGCRQIEHDEITRLLLQFHYTPLPAPTPTRTYLRLLKILPRQADGRIHCKLKQYILGDLTCPEYDALSYSWGKALASILISCNHRDLPVRPNVAAALSRLRLRGCRYIWIDAICINQEDVQERDRQVQIMRQIYNRASRVWIWIGGEDGADAYGVASNIAFPTLRRYAREPAVAANAHAERSRAKSKGDSPDRGSTSALEHLALKNAMLPNGSHTPKERDFLSAYRRGVQSYNERRESERLELKSIKKANDLRAQKEHNAFSAALQHILSQPWFDRMWCVQEVIMSKRATVISGPHEISWGIFCEGLKVAVSWDESCGQVWGALRRESLFSLKVQGLAEYEQPYESDTAASFLLRMLLRYRGRLSSDPRDKVFALVGLVRYFFGELRLSASYTTPVSDVHENTASYILGQTQNLDLFAACEGVPTLRTWAPVTSLHESIPEPLQRNYPNRFCASAESVSCPVVYANRTLVLDGMLLSRIECVGSEVPLGKLQGRDWDFLEYTGFLTQEDGMFQDLSIETQVARKAFFKGGGGNELRDIVSTAASRFGIKADLPLWRGLIQAK